MASGPWVPILPPIRLPENSSDRQTSRHSVAQQGAVREPSKEEKVAGGVSATLDYDMEQMIDFVAEMAQGMYDLFTAHFCFAGIDIFRSIQPNTAISPEFRKYVSQILTSTRLPSSTVLLALHYLSGRVEMLQSQGVNASTTGHLYHLLTVALMLASKFLDDNTFQNRSWAEVSHIKVSELNQTERDWLFDINWILHFDVNDPKGFKGWMQQWELYRTKKAELSVSMESLKLNPVDPNRMQYPATRYNPQTGLYTPPYTENFKPNMGGRTQPWQQWATRNSPPSAGPSGPTTPEWYRQSIMGFGQHSMAYSNRPLPPLQVLPSNHSPYWGGYQQFTPSPWGLHNAACGCGYCALHHERYAMSATYSMHTVAA